MPSKTNHQKKASISAKQLRQETVPETMKKLCKGLFASKSLMPPRTGLSPNLRESKASVAEGPPSDLRHQHSKPTLQKD